MSLASPVYGGDDPVGVRRRFARYRHLFWRGRWYLLIAGILLAVGGVAVGVFLAYGNPELTATALIGIEGGEEKNAIRDVSGLPQAQPDLVTSRSLLREVVMRHSLNMELERYSRAQVFDSLRIDSSAAVGNYAFLPDPAIPGFFTLRYTSRVPGGVVIQKLFNIGESHDVARGDTASLRLINRQGLYLDFSSAFLADPHPFSFEILPVADAVERLYERIELGSGDSPTGITSISIRVRGKDYPLITATVNAIADEFVEKNRGFKRQRTRSVLASLEKQLDIARSELASAESQLRVFRTSHPMVGVSENLRQRVGTLVETQSALEDSRRRLEEARELRVKFSNAPLNELALRAAEVGSFLEAQGVAGGAALRQRLGLLRDEERELSLNYAYDHPVVEENRRQMRSLTGEMAQALERYETITAREIATRQNQVGMLSEEVETLPTREIHLAQLDRRLQIASDIYAAVLNNYNQVKASSAGENAEVFVLDYATIPVVPPIDLPKTVALLAVIALILLIMPLVIWQTLSPAVHDEDEFERQTGSLPFETIPRSSALISRNTKAGRTPLNHEDLPPIINEIFKTLRVKVLARLEQSPGKAIVVTSLEPSVGKSTIAANLAAAIAEQKITTLLIDGDLRCGTLHEVLGTKRSRGLSDFLEGTTPASSEGIIQKTCVRNLSLISSGSPELGSSELLASDRFKLLTRELIRQFQVVIVDAPPLGPVADAAVIDPASAVYLAVVRAGTSDVLELVRKIDEFPGMAGNVMGFILNFVPLDGKMKYYRYSRYYTRFRNQPLRSPKAETGAPS